MADPQDCPECYEHFATNPFLVEACASVGIKHGADTATMLRRYLAVYHQRGHRDETGGRGKISDGGGGGGEG